MRFSAFRAVIVPLSLIAAPAFALGPPSATTATATTPTSSAATLNGTANPNGESTTGWFRYSTTNPGLCDDAFGNRAPATGGTDLGTGSANVAYAQGIGGLSAGTPYFYCAIAANGSGTAFGAVLSVTPPPAVLQSVVSRKTHGAAGPQEIVVDTVPPIGGAVTVEPRAIGAGHQLAFRFNEPITVKGAASAIDSSSAPIGVVNSVAAGSEVQVTLAGIPDNSRATIALVGVNGATNAAASLHFLLGDVNSTRVVNAIDLSAVKARSGQTADASSFRFDPNVNGAINAADIAAVKSRSGQEAVLAAKQAAFDQIAAQADFFLSPFPTSTGQGGAYQDLGFTVRATAHNDPILAIKGFGKNPPSLVTLPFTGTVRSKSAEIVYHNNRGTGPNLVPHIVDRGNFDKWMQFYNSIIGSNYYETNPASLSPPVGLPIDILFGLRHTPRVNDEGAHGFRNLGQNGGNLTYTPTTPTLVATSTYTPYEDQVIRLYIDAGGNWQFWKNGVSMTSGTGAAFSSTELILGTNSHVDHHQFRFLMYKFGQYNTQELNTVYSNAQTIWPWNTKPTYPYIHNLYQTSATAVFDGPNNAFEFGFGFGGGTFSGGNGIPGTHQYRWFYVDRADTTLFPGGDTPFRINRQVPALVDIATMAAGNAISAIAMDGVNLLGAPVNFTTSVANTNALLAAAINAGPQSANFFGYVRNGKLQVHILNNNYRPDVLTVTASGFTPALIQTPRGKSLSRATYSQAGQIYDGGKLLDSSVLLMCAIAPFDSAGNRGEDIYTGWYASNF